MSKRLATLIATIAFSWIQLSAQSFTESELKAITTLLYEGELCKKELSICDSTIALKDGVIVEQKSIIIVQDELIKEYGNQYSKLSKKRQNELIGIGVGGFSLTFGILLFAIIK